MRTAKRSWARLGLVLAALLASPGMAWTQDASALRTPASVDYVGVEGLYLAVGSDQGVVRGDTVEVYRDEDASTPAGRVVFTSVTRRRSVATVVDGSMRLAQGDLVFVVLAPPPAAATAARPDEPARAMEPTRRSARASGPRISGRLALDLDVRETRTAWSGDLFGETRRRFATPTTRLSLVASELPGGFGVRASARASYRYDELGAGPPPLSIRAYELAAVKSFERIPVEIMLGRFGNPHESYSAYWDGVLLRLGRSSGPGLGVVAGYEPELYNEGFSRSVPKATAFADFAVRGSSWRYDGDVSFHVIRPSGAAERRFLGWSQRLRLGRVALSQRLRADVPFGGARWSVAELRLRGAIDVVGPLRLRGTFSRTGGAGTRLVWLEGSTPLAVRREITAGFDLTGSRASMSLEGARTDRGTEQPGWSLYGRAGLRIWATQLLLSGRRWASGNVGTWSFAPAVFFETGPLDWQAGYRLYRTANGPREIKSHSAQAQVGAAVMRGTRVTVRGEQQWGPSLRGTRIQLGLWRSF